MCSSSGAIRTMGPLADKYLAGCTPDFLSNRARLTISLVHLHDLKSISAAFENVIVDLHPVGQSYQLRTGELDKWTEIQAIDCKTGNVQASRKQKNQNQLLRPKKVNLCRHI